MMTNKAFLEYVAEDILLKHGNNLSRTAVVFPNKRASLFMNEFLAKRAGKPIWSPAYITISELFERHSSLRIGDSIKLIADLHKSFIAKTGIDETLDHFYGWGLLLLADFDDIDKNMANAHQVFANLSNYHELDDVSYLTEEQIATLKRFFQNFNEEHNTKLKERFLQLWNHFEDIYTDYRQRLLQQNLAYEGMLYRDVAENENLDMYFDQYLFVGFNMLQRVEQQLFAHLQDQGKARFYWDFDDYYMSQTNEAGYFVKQYLQAFPNELDNHRADIYNNLRNKKVFNIVSAATENVQARYVDAWLKGNAPTCQAPAEAKPRMEKGRKTAIVMCNESLLPTVVHSLPDALGEANITTGYPLSDTPAVSLANLLIAMRLFPSKSGHRRLMNHAYAPALGEGFRIIKPDASPLETLKWMIATIKTVAANRTPSQTSEEIQAEALFKTYTLLNRLATLIEGGDVAIDVITLQRLIQQLFATTSIPFHGEPAVGVQIMGVLETRNLDFDHLLILSCNEGFMPRNVNDASFIPHSIRKAFGLTTIDHKIAVFSYYFHRLIQRANDVTITYNNSTEDGHTGEMSRFLMQLMVESPINITRQTLLIGQTPYAEYRQHEVEKDEAIMQKLHEFHNGRKLYPTSINRYLRCQLMFYFNDVLGFREPDAEEEVIDSRAFGNIFHRASELFYQELGIKRPLQQKEISHALKQSALIDKIVDQAIREEVFNQAKQMPELNGLQIINREVIIRYLRRLLEIDQQLAPFTVLGTEEKVCGTTRISTSKGSFDIHLSGIIDRLDQVDEKVIRVVDYKTGGRALTSSIKSVDEIFAHPMLRDKHPDYFLQAMLYALIVKNKPEYNPQQLPVSPALLFIQHTKGAHYDPVLSIDKRTISDIGEYETDFMQQLNQVLAEMFEPQVPFRPTPDHEVCNTCPYRMMCHL